MHKFHHTFGILFLLIYSLITYNSNAQTAACPEIKFVQSSPLNISCVDDTCINLKARLPNIRQTANNNTGYIVNSVPFTEAQPFNIAGSNRIFVNQDDQYSSVINLPFTFCYFGNNYNAVVIGANGTISFNTRYANTYSSFEQCLFNTIYRLPRSDNNHPSNTIFAALHDIDPSNPSSANRRIEWSITGTAPCRKMIINWFEITQFACNNNRSTFQCVLYENTNVIDIFIKQKPVCANWNCGVATIGVQNANSTIAITPPNRNATVFNVTTSNSEGWRFLPNGNTLLVNNNVSLYDENNSLIQTVNPTSIGSGLLEANFTTPVCFRNTASRKKYYVKANYTPCSGNNLAVIDSIIIDYTPKPAAPSAVSPQIFCLNSPSRPLTATGTNLKWYTSATGGTASNTAPTINTNTVGRQTYYVSQTVNNCESSRKRIDVDVIDNILNTINDTICQGDSVLFKGTYYKTPVSNLKDTFVAIGGCDSIVTFNLRVKDSIVNTVTQTICENALPYTWNGQTINTFGNRVGRYVTLNAAGCDSIVYLNLNSKPTYNITQNITICNNQLPYTWNGVTVTQGGNNAARVTRTARNGCDSVVILNLTVNDTIRVNQSQHICSNNLPFTWNGQTITTSGQHTLRHNATRSNGCDSVTILNLTVTDSIVTPQNITICREALPYTWNGQSYNQGGNNIGRFRGTSRAGCDSIAVLNLTVRTRDSIVVNRTVCNNQLPFIWNGINVSRGGNNAAQFTTSGSDGCDSLTILNLIINDTIKTVDNITTCANRMPITWNGIRVTQGGNNVATYRTSRQNGCDSIVSLNLTIADTTGCEKSRFEAIIRS